MRVIYKGKPFPLDNVYTSISPDVIQPETELRSALCGSRARIWSNGYFQGMRQKEH